MAIVFTCSEDEDFGSLGDNKVIVTGGTSAIPATFADFVTADRAGEAVLLAATSGIKAMTLTYQIRGVEDLALLINFIVAAKTAEADYIFITGTDFAGNAQTESIDVAAGNGTYVSTKYFKTITQIDCEDVGDGSGTAWADGTLRVTQDVWGVIWDYGNGQYRVDCDFDVGNASTSTYFSSKDEQIVFPDDMPRARASATLTIGEASTSYSKNGSVWRVTGQDTSRFMVQGGTLVLYGSMLMYDTALLFLGISSGTINFYESIINGPSKNYGMQINSGLTVNLRNIYASNFKSLILNLTPNSFTNVHFEDITRGIQAAAGSTPTLTGLKITNASNEDVLLNNSVLKLVNPDFTLGTIIHLDAADETWQQHTCNIHIADKDGTVLQSVVVDCEDTNGTAVWAAGTVTTDANGDIAEQTITYKQWAGTDETLTTYSPHKFTISKAGYETLILDNVTVDGPIKWHEELQTLNKLFGTSNITKVCGVG